VNCEPDEDAIVAAIKTALALDARNIVNPYGDGYSAGRIRDRLKAIPDFRALLQKRFFEVSEATRV
jgi:hypothetical protein